MIAVAVDVARRQVRDANPLGEVEFVRCQEIRAEAIAIWSSGMVRPVTLDRYTPDRPTSDVAARLDERHRFHDLRHTFGTAMAGAGVPMRTLQEWLGHRDIATTQRYAGYAPSAHEAACIVAAFETMHAQHSVVPADDGDRSVTKA